ncbi:MAG: 50S ribosomal protein L13 [Bacteroidetes bacterium]|jgi:large subunit ribosomal protein L13|nr:50S ribosomal protein L13 [Bacteroidota bacterium]
MDSLSYKTTSITPEQIEHKWVLIDATDLVLGRLASQVAAMLRGKHKPYFTPNLDCGDHVVIVNAERVRLTGNKINTHTFVYHTGYPGGQRERSAALILEKNPEQLLENAIRRMLPKNKLGHQIISKLHVYAGEAHKHEAQNPQPLAL